MPTSVHIPKALLEAVDRRARALNLSRNKLIVQALEREVTAGADWPADFFEKLAAAALPKPQIEKLRDAMLKLETLKDATEIARLLAKA